MAGLLAWAADVVGAHGGDHTNEPDAIPLIFSDDQQKYVGELNRTAASLTRAIQDLRLRLPPPDISQRLPHLLAHSLASNAALALQLNAHSATKEQAQLREETLQEEIAAYEKAISNCEKKIEEKAQEADLLKRKLQEIDETEISLKQELEDAESELESSKSGSYGDQALPSTGTEAEPDVQDAKFTLSKKLEEKKKELSDMEEIVHGLEKKWAKVQDTAQKKPTPAQREKILDKQLHSLIEQLETKQAQAEGLASEIHVKEIELERLNGLWRRLQSNNLEANNARNRYGRSNSERGPTGSSSSLEFIADKLPYSTSGRTEQQKRLMLMRSAFVLYILLLHVLVFIKISF